MTEDTKKLETLSYKQEYKGENIPINTLPKPANAPPATLGFNSHVIKPEMRVNKREDAGQALEYPEMCENTKLIVKACRQVVQSAEDYETDTMTTPVTVVDACERLNCVLEKLKSEAMQGMEKMGFVPGMEGANLTQPEQPNLKIIAEIEGLISQVNDKLGGLVAPNEPYDLTKMGKEYISQALEEIDIFQKTTLFELRKAFE